MTDYKSYSINQMKDWIHDALSSGEATPQEIYDSIKEIVSENLEYHRSCERNANELLNLLNGNRIFDLNSYSSFDYSGLGHNYSGFGYDSNIIDPGGNNVTGISSNPGIWNYNTEDKITFTSNSQPQKWTIPVEVDASSGEYFITLPNELMDKVDWEENDEVQWVNNDDGSFSLKKV